MCEKSVWFRNGTGLISFTQTIRGGCEFFSGFSKDEKKLKSIKKVQKNFVKSHTECSVFSDRIQEEGV